MDRSATQLTSNSTDSNPSFAINTLHLLNERTNHRISTRENYKRSNDQRKSSHKQPKLHQNLPKTKRIVSLYQIDRSSTQLTSNSTDSNPSFAICTLHLLNER
eukprot:TRINITY_DN11928_c0_g1_i1.p1 TRINITY_DN11928_c0_g1~~TRINITY_DN11928_c0_g1_i1.p1  ORF type:complete len:103 (-),score=5.46 TRINITY_DN11928_c0_g1_i1:136-444(-)